MPRVDDCRDCKPVLDPWLEVVNGTIIGGEDEHAGQHRYRFYDKGDVHCIHPDIWFADDGEARKWLGSYLDMCWPHEGVRHYPQGVEMRCYCD